jgi:hypothetical protein
MDGFSSVSWPMVDFGSGGVEAWISVATLLVSYIETLCWLVLPDIWSMRVIVLCKDHYRFRISCITLISYLRKIKIFKLVK